MSKKENVFISGIHYETDEYIEIEISDGFIGEIRCSGKQINKGCETYIAPGLIDSQTNGYLGINFQDELFSVERMRFAAKAIWKDGVTTYVPTLVTESRENLLRNFRILAMAIEDKQLMGCIPGFHLEGPYLSSIQGFYGCHNAKYLRNPSIDEFNELQEAAQGHIIIVTIAPELEGAIEFIKYCSENGVVVSIGHTNATTEQIYRAVDNGARMSTHLGNGCANMINRHRNPLWPQLANDSLTPSIIADGFHLLPEEIKTFYKAKGDNNITITSDVTHLAGMPPGKYSYMGSEVVMNDEGRIFNPSLNCLAGASSPLKKGIETMMRFTGCTLGQAANLAGRNVARLLGLSDRGIIEQGKRADIILFTLAHGKVTIKETWVAGRRVYPDRQ